MIWTNGSVSFRFGKGGFGILANCSLCGTKATPFFSVGPVCSSFFADAQAGAILQALCWSRQHHQACHFSSPPLRLSLCLYPLSSSPSFLLPQSFWQELSSLSSCSNLLQRVPGHSFLPRNDVADELARREALVVPSAIPCSLSPVISRIHSSLFSDRRRAVSSKFFDTQVPSISTKELVLPRHVCCVLSRHARCYGHRPLLSSYLFGIVRIENPSCSAC